MWFYYFVILLFGYFIILLFYYYFSLGIRHCRTYSKKVITLLRSDCCFRLVQRNCKFAACRTHRRFFWRFFRRFFGRFFGRFKTSYKIQNKIKMLHGWYYKTWGKKISTKKSKSIDDFIAKWKNIKKIRGSIIII